MPFTPTRARHAATKSFAVAAGILVCVCAVAAPVAAAPSTPNLIPPRAHVLEVIDGDTLLVRYSGAREKFVVDIVGIDAPEGEECWAAQSAQFAADTLTGRNIGLAPEKSLPDAEPTGAVLRHVLLDNDMDGDYALTAARQGAARAHTADEMGLGRQLVAAEEDARNGHRGLWTCDGSAPVAAPRSDPGPRPAP
ncbi:thermonuclease family protein [Rhodococcus sp. NPDC056960]|uniref:thermonuclease family protein n=1 Tax=Rhodococcus sp. NPDC056960 TaxID=3345982 RepID=UPI0036402C58